MGCYMLSHELLTLITETVSTRKTTFYAKDGEVYDRSLTCGASEVFSCPRRVAYLKQGLPEDVDFVPSWGFAERGNNIEPWMASAINESLPPKYIFNSWGTGQVTLSLDELSCTPDGILHSPNGAIQVVEIKSIDPRYKGELPKDAHILQVQVQLGIMSHLRESNGDSPVNSALLIYVNASDYSDIKIFDLQRDSAIFNTAKERAKRVFNEDPDTLSAEGKYLGECDYCAYTERCGESILKFMPKGEDISEEQEETLFKLISEKDEIDIEHKNFKKKLEEKSEEIRTYLRNEDIQKVNTDEFSVSYSTMAGRRKLDFEAIEGDGIDLSDYYTIGKPSQILRTKRK